MQKKIFFCDYCGKEVKEEEQVSMLYITAPKKLIGKTLTGKDGIRARFDACWDCTDRLFPILVKLSPPIPPLSTTREIPN